MIELNAATIAAGGLVERLNDKIQKAVCNCQDINTPAEKVRTVKLAIKIKPDKSRCFAGVTVETSSMLCPPEPISTSITMGTNLKTGEIVASEMFEGENPNQTVLPGTEKDMPSKITAFPGGK